MKLILNYLKNYKKIFLLNVISVFGFALVELGIPTIVARMIDRGISGRDAAYIWKMGGVILVISLVGVAGTILLGYCCAYLSTSVVRDLRNDIFRKTQTFSHSEFNRFGTSSLITRTNNDAFQIQMFMNILLRTALMTPVMIVSSIVLVLKASLRLSMVILATIPLIILGVIIVAKISESISENQQNSLEWINRISRENLSGIRVIRAFTNDNYEKKRFDEANLSYMKFSKRLFKLMSVTQPVFFLLMNLAGMLIYWISSILINQNSLQVGQLVAFMDYLFHVMFSIMLFCLVFMMYPKAQVSARRITKVLKTTPSIPTQITEHGEGTEGGNRDSGDLNKIDIKEIRFEHVTFVYPDGEEAVLKDVSFAVNRGETIAFIGSTGSGKSTLINLVPRAYDVTEGSILINGEDIRKLPAQELRQSIGFIPQKAMLFGGTIAENIRYGKKDASMEEVAHAAKVAHAYDFIMEKGGFEELITENATNVSGGQRQRLSIARALVRRPDVYIFDDSFSALDFKTDAKLRGELKKETKEAIVMIVAQRISSIVDADRIVVLNEGSVVGIGTHQELMKGCQIYREIALSQLSEEELANA
ncbi:ABC transporter ATP-binding protein [Diplocloster agilis]|uniref:ABC transporter ATP-binding protein/permease n=1 Tax=Diplocloster agilis TaxID=2850323 RepID=A0A949K2L3_9FIRM|nr:ABC transporter ATP-binding protein [Diplocloster agilis]MBU9738564.1 ABC transporter ATP-binding protein/permease [Diplocloster agilis]